MTTNGLAMFSVGFVKIVKLPKTLISQLKYSRCYRTFFICFLISIKINYKINENNCRYIC